jgi:predicted DCC family thiol-disulfide oxidoreductase YuxK
MQGQMYLIRSDGSIVSGPAAIAEIFKLSKAPLRFLCNFLYTRQARRIYVWVARRRYSLFGCRDTCYAVDPQRSHGPD